MLCPALATPAAPNAVAVSVWRQVRVGAEWLKLQTLRFPTVVLRLVVVLFFLYGADVQDYAENEPGLAEDYEAGASAWGAMGWAELPRVP